MDLSKSTSYYLCGESVPEHINGGFICFSAKFSDACDIKNCYIIASSLNDAVTILYSNLAPIWTAEYLDSHFLSISFLTKLSYLSLFFHVDDSIHK